MVISAGGWEELGNQEFCRKSLICYWRSATFSCGLSNNSSLLHGSSRLFPLVWTCVIAFLGSGQFQALHPLLETVTCFVVEIVLSLFCPPNFSLTFRRLDSKNIVIRFHPGLRQFGNFCRLTNCISR